MAQAFRNPSDLQAAVLRLAEQASDQEARAAPSVTDANGRPLGIGDMVVVPARILAINGNGVLALRTMDRRPSFFQTVKMSVHSDQAVLATAEIGLRAFSARFNVESTEVLCR